MLSRPFLLFLLFPLFLGAQSNEGTEFWFGFMQHVDVNQNQKVVMISSKQETRGIVSIPNRGFLQEFEVSKDEVTIMKLPAYTENIGSEEINDVGVYLQSEEPVSVYIHQYSGFRSEATLVLPLNSIGKEYYTMSYRGVVKGIAKGDNGSADHPSEFLIVSTRDDSYVTIELSDDAMHHEMGSTINVQLNKGETYQVQSATGNGDLSGCYIKSNHDFVLFSGNSWTEVPTGCDSRDNLMEQMYAIDSWGKNFVAAPSANMPYDLFRIMASEDNTAVEVIRGNSPTPVTYFLDRGQYEEFRSYTGIIINANKPVQVGQYLIGENCSGHEYGDPSMFLLNSITQTRDTVTLYNSALQDIRENFINIICFTTDIPFLSVDGEALTDEAEVNTIGRDEVYSYVTIAVASGAHTVVSEGCGVIALAYGYGPLESYAYSGGASFNTINSNPIPEGGCINDTVYFNANLPDTRYSFIWDLGQGDIREEASFSVHYTEKGSYPVQLIITDNCIGTSDTLRRNVLIEEQQTIEAYGDTTLCASNEFSLRVSDLENAKYTWFGPLGYTSDEQNPIISEGEPLMSGTYAVIASVTGCHTEPSETEISILKLPNPVFEIDSSYCNRRKEVIIQAGNFESYLWQDNSTQADFLINEPGRYSVTVTNDLGCEKSAVVNMREQCPTEYYVPNAFSPNDDGVNDEWMIYGHDIVDFHLIVKDRWGEIMFTSEEQSNPWNGEFLGKPVASDVYMYSLSIEGVTEEGDSFTEELFGTVMILR